MRDYEFYYTQDGSIGLYSYVDNDRMQDHSKDLGIIFGNNLNSFLFDIFIPSYK